MTKVSIVCITYNHEKYIENALNSFLSQKTNFDYEIIVCDDHSIDNTVNIIEEIRKKNQEKIKLIEKNNQSDNSIKEDVLTSEDLKQLSNENQDTIAYIKVNNTNIKYPIVQTNNNEYYLNHSFDKTKNNAGWVFMDYKNNKNFEDENTILYAHNRKDKSMFGTLDNLLKIDMTNEYPLIYISTINQKMLYKIFSVYTIETEDYYIKTTFDSNEKAEWLDVIKNRNQAQVSNDVNVNDKILTLSTCYNNDEMRLVVHAKRIM